MEHAGCDVIYVDRSVSRDRCVRRSEKDAAQQEGAHVAENLKLLLDIFHTVHLCSTGVACLTRLRELQETSVVALKPTLILLDTPYQDQFAQRSRSTSPSSRAADDSGNQDEDLYGLALLRRIVSEAYIGNSSKLVVTVPVVALPTGDPSCETRRAANRRMLKECLDFGATDVMESPMNAKCINNLEVHVYRAHLDAARDQQALLALRRGRKRSWVGVNDEMPFSYLREAMVSKLLDRICRTESEIEDVPASISLPVSTAKQAEISSAVGRWHFSAHELTDDELVVAAMVMFKHALSMPELAPWRISTDQLHRFLLACREAYIKFVPYHNFRHVVDVLQATFHFLVSIGSLPHYPAADGLPSEADPKSPIAKLLRPFEALTLLITAIGHDVGHPGVNNGFLITLNTPLAQLYNDRSVLESFHCAAYSQILRRYWPSAFSDGRMRNLLISSILATDMSLHFDYMKKLEDLQDKLRADDRTEGWDEKLKYEQTATACALLMKCADISNVARQLDVAEKWMYILSDEFLRQGTMERALAIPTSLMSEPKRDRLSLVTSQLKFMDLFAVPLFRGVADILPGMQYCVDQLLQNRGSFKRIQEQERQSPSEPILHAGDGEPCPEALSFTTFPEPPTEVHPLKATRGPVPRVVEPHVAVGPTAVQESEPFQRPHQCSRRPPSGRRVSGIVTSFTSTSDFGHSEPSSSDNGHPHDQTGHRCSEMTDGSSAPNSGDWGASQATSATTGKMPLSPSTQGTSIVSYDSFEHPNSVPVTSTPPGDESTTTVPDSASKSQADFKTVDDCSPLALHEEHNDSPGNGHATNGAGKTNGLEPDPENRQLKKKPSRFRINMQNLFRKHKTASPADTAG
ncbi:uncharacterized protein B0T15DRAFT_404466 [Chaetomium strumarium]|uniref:Phosphodiesterase n=1 Tax=Chaetomium strumarium TaxID=1170767 RepID=A0AAJ0GLU2_9PEZI|nr:hypothetical protein B0T15DRAFT_404466 [Chaetomium strumarium]